MSLDDTTPVVRSVSKDRNLEGFRFGLDFSDQDIHEVRYRDPIANFLTDGITREALGDAFIIKGEDKKEIANWDEWRKFLENSAFLDNLIQHIADVRAYGSAGVLMFNTGEIKSFIPNTLRIKFDTKTREMTQATCVEKFELIGLEEDEHTIPLTGDPDVDPFHYSIIKQGEKTFKGISELQAAWDVMQSLWVVDFMAAMYAVRVGGGFKIVKAATSDEGEKGEILQSLRDLSWKSAAVLGLEDEFQLYTGEGSIDFEKLKNILYDTLASVTGIPKTKWRGEVPGELSAGSINRSSYIDVLKQIQDATMFILRKLLKLASAFKGLDLPSKFIVEWNYKEEPTEREKAEIDGILADTFLMKANFMTGAEIREEAELDELDFFKEKDIPLQFLLQDSSIRIQLGDDENIRTNPPVDTSGKPETGETEPEPGDPTSDDNEPASDTDAASGTTSA